MGGNTPARQIPLRGLSIAVVGGNRSTYYASHWLRLLGCQIEDQPSDADIVITAGTVELEAADDHGGASALIRLWDFQVGQAGTGVHASAVAGVASTIGYPDGPGAPLPADMPEKWCAAYGVILALAEAWRRKDVLGGSRAVYDLSAADVMRTFSLQNAGDEAEIARRWRRNGRICVEHGGIFPMGFYACRDGYVALLGRSRRDWRNIRAAIGDPEWARAPKFEDPFALARDSAEADRLLEETLSAFDRDDLLARGLAAEAVIAPVFTQDEAGARGVFREGLLGPDGPAMPFLATPISERQITMNDRRPASQNAGMPLSGFRCVELCWVWSGPMVGQILADLGAEVIKVEAPGRFDLYRTRGLEHLRGKMHEKTRIESSIYFHSLNRNKLGLALDLKAPAALSATCDLIAQSDLVIENFTVGTTERLGLGPEVLGEANPALVSLSMSGPGRGSSVEALRSYGLVLSALGGAEAEIGDENGFLGSPTFSISDPNAAVFAAMAALAGALRARDTGTGSAIDISQIEAAATLVGTPVPQTKRHETVLETADGAYVAVSVPLEAFKSLSATRAALCPLDEAAVRAECARLGGEAVELVELDGSDAAPAFAGYSGWVASSHPYTGEEMLVAAPWRIAGARPAARKPAPLLGESNDYVLRHILGLNDETISKLEKHDEETAA